MLVGGSMFNSEELYKIQSSIVNDCKNCLSNSTIDFHSLNDLIFILKKVDNTRRETWHQEKFGPYEKIADKIFSSDDIPF